MITELASVFDEGEDWGTAARINHPSGAALVIADVAKWQVQVFDLGDHDSVSYLKPVYRLTGVNPAVNNTNAALPGAPLVISNTLLLDGYWTKGGAGRNFLHFISKADTNVVANDGWAKQVPPFSPRGGRQYLAEYGFQLVTSGRVIWLKHKVTVGAILSPKIV